MRGIHGTSSSAGTPKRTIAASAMVIPVLSSARVDRAKDDHRQMTAARARDAGERAASGHDGPRQGEDGHEPSVEMIGA